MRKLFVSLILLSIISVASAEFTLESVNVKVSNIGSDGSAKVQESIKFLVKGNQSKLLYDSGFKTTDDLSFWTNITKIKDVRQHVNPSVVSISNFRLQPQPRSGCNPFVDFCHGELLIDYTVKPEYNGSVIVNGTGLFLVDEYKPRTTRFTLNPEALSFTNTDAGNLILEPEIYLTLELPQGSKVIEVNPSPVTDSVTDSVEELVWNDMVLVRFSLIYDVEESIDLEVSRFFSDALSDFQDTVRSQHGMAFIAIMAILVGSYIYINVSKKKREE